MNQIKALISSPYVSSAIFISALVVTGFILLILSLLALLFFPITVPVFLVIKYTPIKGYLYKLYHIAYDYVFYQSEKPRKFLWGLLYDSMCTYYPITKWRNMNYGYAVLNDSGKTIANLNEQQEQERFCLQLYDYVATNMWKQKSLKGLTVLEVGSGRGGGLHYILDHKEPKACFGVDYSQKQVEFCQLTYKDIPNLTFTQGDSEDLTQFTQEFDLIINIESSHCYGNFKKFIEQVTQRLKKGGTFVIADFRAINEIPQLEQDLISTGLRLVAKDDITINVSHAMRIDEKRKKEWINRNCNILIRPLFKKFSGFTNSRVFKEFQKRESVYMVYSLQK